jgi:FkbM family methyltransferase
MEHQNTAPTKLQKSRIFRVFVRLVLRVGRLTKYLPNMLGYFTFQRLYHKYIPEDLHTRIYDFDGDLILDVNVRGNTDMSLWHFPKHYEKEEREIFCAAITPGCTVLDVGANIGMYTLLAAKRGAQVFAIEADPINAAMLRHHVDINGFADRVTIFEMAATDSAQIVPLYRHPFNLGESNIVAKGMPSGTVEGRTIDSLNLPSIDVCKMDIEGAELKALLGMKDTLARSPRLKLLVEHAAHYGNGEALVSYLRSTFSSVKVIEEIETGSAGEIPAFCNLLAIR